MSLLTLIGIAVALAMDAFAVAIAVGISLKSIHYRQVFRLAWHFGLFQAMMPVIGWAAGTTVRSHIQDYDHWIAFALLTLVGGNMLREAFFGDEEENGAGKDATRGLTLVVLSVATSIDALAVGITFAFLTVDILPAVHFIGFTTLVLSFLGVVIGNRFGLALKSKAEIAGGSVLVLIGLKILFEHLGILVF